MGTPSERSHTSELGDREVDREKGWVGPVEKLARMNENFRTVLYTGDRTQLVVMNVPGGSEIGEETHEHVEQVLVVVEGCGTAWLDGEPRDVGPGDVVVVEPGTRHNVTNAATDPLKLFTVYAPPNHIEGRVHRTKADADEDQEDEEFGHRVH